MDLPAADTKYTSSNTHKRKEESIESKVMRSSCEVEAINMNGR